jgi:hypothetical protein
MKTNNRNRKQLFPVLSLVTILVLLFALYFTFRKSSEKALQLTPDVMENVVDRTLRNYGTEVLKHAKTHQLPPEYLLALIILESSGRKIIPPRFEPHVFERLKEVKNNQRAAYEHVTPEHLADATHEALKNLASSWGPFQLMGYKCLLLDIKVKDIRGNDAIYWGIHWIDLTYGRELRNGKYKDAFHIHNTGRRHPLVGKPFTHDPNYVTRGLEYMKAFEQALKTFGI